MPMYDYVCLDCKQGFERIRPAGEADTRQECPNCSGDRVRRRLAVVASFVREKGSSGSEQYQSAGGGCGCGGSCACGGHRLN